MNPADLVTAAVADALGGAPGRIHVAYSGGLDSTVLLHAARTVGAPVALHVDHGLHAWSARWAAQCAAQCEQWQVPLRCHRAALPAGGNMEAAARHARYAYFADQLEPGDLLLVAHHRDDQVETLLLRLLQGRGLYGMPSQRPLGNRGARLWRPLLGVPRDTLRAYARQHELTWVEDPSNAATDLDRNWLRHRVLPLLRERWKDADGALLQAWQHQVRRDAALLAGLGGAGSPLVVARLPHDAQGAADALRIWLTARGARLPTRRALTEFVQQLAAPADRQPLLALDAGAAGASLRRWRGRVYHVPAPTPLASSYRLPADGVLNLPHGELRCAPPGASELAVEFLATRASAVVCANGRARHVRALLQAAGVPPWERDRYPLLVAAGEVVAVPGIAPWDGQQSRWHAHEIAT